MTNKMVLINFMDKYLENGSVYNLWLTVFFDFL